MRQVHGINDVTSEWGLFRHPLRMPNIDLREYMKTFYAIMCGYQGENSPVRKSCTRCIRKKNQYRKLEQALKVQHDEHKNAMKQAADALQVAKDDAKRLAEQINEADKRAHHQLRQQLAAINAFSSQLADELTELKKSLVVAEGEAHKVPALRMEVELGQNQLAELKRKYKLLKRTYISKVREFDKMQVDYESLKKSRLIFTQPSLAIPCKLT